VHKLAIQVAENNPQAMNLALNNARNAADHFKAKGNDGTIVVVTFGPGGAHAAGRHQPGQTAHRRNDPGVCQHHVRGLR
jgi:hypothetical protein